MRKYSLLIQWSEEDQLYLATCPEFRNLVNVEGAFTHGDTWEEAAREAAVALEGVSESLEEDKIALPEPKLYDGEVYVQKT